MCSYHPKGRFGESTQKFFSFPEPYFPHQVLAKFIFCFKNLISQFYLRLISKTYEWTLSHERLAKLKYKLGQNLLPQTMPQVVLVHPQIPQNTGNIARSCAATGTELHLVAPLGFEISDRYLKRAGLDYWPYVKLHHHESLEAFKAIHQERGGRCLGFTVRGNFNYVSFQFQVDDWLLFGSETTGLPSAILSNCDATLYIPMAEPHVRSLNLSVSVAVSLFESHRQLGYLL